MGREPRKCIIVDNSPASYLLQPENAIPISSWFDAPNDQQLLLMLPWLQVLLPCKQACSNRRASMPLRKVPFCPGLCLLGPAMPCDALAGVRAESA